MTSQMDTPNSYKLPVNHNYALLDEQGWVIAMVKWVSGDDGKLTEFIYALDEATLAQVPRLSGDVGVEDWYHDMIAKDQLVHYYHEVVPQHEDVLRIDDARPDHCHSYRVYNGPRLSMRPRLVPGAVYYCYAGDDTEVGEHSRLEDFEAVMALRDHSAAVHIDDLRGLSSKMFDDPVIVAMFGDLTTAIRIQNEFAISQSFMAGNS